MVVFYILIYYGYFPINLLYDFSNNFAKSSVFVSFWSMVIFTFKLKEIPDTDISGMELSVNMQTTI